MPPFYNDLVSMLPHSSPKAAAVPAIGSPAPIPAEFGITAYSAPTLIACVRHCGCPFAENEIRTLAKLSNEHPSLQVIVVAMSSEEDVPAWFKRIGGDEFKDASRVKVIADPTRKVYAELGVGLLGWGGMFSGEMVANLKRLRSEGVVNTETVAGSYRWQNSGGFAVGPDGLVKFAHIAKHAGDMVDYAAAAATLGL
ncbi:hypothetical protein RQP46_000612 [Phenoliferia psychrophenolica]